MQKPRPESVPFIAGIAVPIIYFGCQILAAPYFPGYSFLDRDASTLGSDGSTFPLVFNAGVIITGILALIAAGGYFNKLRQIDVSQSVRWLIAIAMICCGWERSIQVSFRSQTRDILRASSRHSRYLEGLRFRFFYHSPYGMLRRKAYAISFF